jgi:hypothetical protein
MGLSMSFPSPTQRLIELFTIWWMERGRPTTPPLRRPAYTISVFVVQDYIEDISVWRHSIKMDEESAWTNEDCVSRGDR